MSPPEAFVRELAAVGVTVESPWDLVNMRQPYPAALPVLLEWLERAERDVPSQDREKFREAVVRALAVKESRGTAAAAALLFEFRRPDAAHDYRWAVGNTLEVVADDSVFREIAELARDRSFGRDRQMVVLALARMKDPDAIDVLCGLLDDENVVGQALTALGRLNARQARPAIEQCLEHSRPWVRREAKKVLAKLVT